MYQTVTCVQTVEHVLLLAQSLQSILKQPILEECMQRLMKIRVSTAKSV